ncbi:jg15827 [Pararge aegeria aegeria]|uniref:Jg15827 protein n=1 Tax=Pararge aegeria aegeria TaxID=348720 RepID=A0A8S4SQI5_9NEOP|nr:jg15827 [Pararge aegeria aegeria]
MALSPVMPLSTFTIGIDFEPLYSLAAQRFFQRNFDKTFGGQRCGIRPKSIVEGDPCLCVRTFLHDIARPLRQWPLRSGAAASSAEQAKRRKYENLDSSFIFVPFGVETLGPWGPEARALFKELSKRVIESTGDPRAGSYLGQRISLAIQRGNAASILGTVPRCGGFEDVLDFI